MSKRIIRVALCASLFALGFPAQAQQPKKIPRIGYLSAATPSAMLDRTQAFRQGLRELGYIEGKNIVIEWRYADGKLDRLTPLADELVGLKVDAIVTGGSGATRPAKQATASIPVVMTQDNDPVANGFVASLARPGGNVTGLSTLSPEISGKRLELLKELVPRLSRVAVIGTSTSQDYAHELKQIELAAGALGLKLQHVDVLASKDIEPAFQAAAKMRADAVLWSVSGRIARTSYRKEITDLAIKWRLPAIYENAASAEAGGLMSYGVSLLDLDRRAATYVDKVLKGAKPAELPVEQPTKFELVINLKTAKRIGLTIPQTVLFQADKVIK